MMNHLSPRGKSPKGIIAYLIYHRWLYLLLIPGVVYFLIFHYMPLYGVILAFKSFSFKGGILGSPWVGMKHFNRLFSDSKFLSVMNNTLLISLYRTLVCVPAAPIFAILLNEITNTRFKRTLQTVSYFPHFISWVVVYGMFYKLLSADGVLNMLLLKVGAQPVSIMASRQKFRSLLVITSLWKGLGWSSIIYLAAIAGIDPSLFEASVIDGANRFQRIIHIVFPGIKGAFFVVLILTLGSIMDAGFEQVFVFYNPIVYPTGDILDTYIYRIGLQDGKYDIATAISLFKSTIGFILLVGVNYISRKYNGVGLY